MWNLLLSHTSSISNPGLPLIIIALLSDKHCITQSSPPQCTQSDDQCTENLLTLALLELCLRLHCSRRCILQPTNPPMPISPNLLSCCCCTTLLYHSAVTFCCTTLLYHSAVPLCCTTLLYQEKEVGLQHNWSRSRRPDAFSPCGSSYTALLLFQNYTDCTKPTDCRASNICLPNNWSRRLRPVHFHHVLPYIALCA